MPGLLAKSLVQAKNTCRTSGADADSGKPNEGAKSVHIVTDFFFSLSLIFLWQLHAADHEILRISAQETDSQATEKIQNVIQAMAEGRYGKKVLLKIESI